MAKKDKIIQGSHSTRIEHSDGTVTFTHDWDKVAKDVNDAIKKYEEKMVKSPLHPNLLKLSKVKLEELGRSKFDIELDRRMTKESMAEELTKLVMKKSKEELDTIAHNRFGIKVDRRKPKEFMFNQIFDTIK